MIPIFFLMVINFQTMIMLNNLYGQSTFKLCKIYEKVFIKHTVLYKNAKNSMIANYMTTGSVADACIEIAEKLTNVFKKKKKKQNEGGKEKVWTVNVISTFKSRLQIVVQLNANHTENYF